MFKVILSLFKKGREYPDMPLRLTSGRLDSKWFLSDWCGVLCASYQLFTRWLTLYFFIINFCHNALSITTELTSYINILKYE